jgi:hypothetical protein
VFFLEKNLLLVLKDIEDDELKSDLTKLIDIFNGVSNTKENIYDFINRLLEGNNNLSSLRKIYQLDIENTDNKLIYTPLKIFESLLNSTKKNLEESDLKITSTSLFVPQFPTISTSNTKTGVVDSEANIKLKIDFNDSLEVV